MNLNVRILAFLFLFIPSFLVIAQVPPPCGGGGQTFIVTNTQPGLDANNAPDGSLRWAILEANKCMPTAGSKHRIEFNIPGTGVHTITPVQFMPRVVVPLVIDGLTQPGATACHPTIELDGTVASTPAPGNPNSDIGKCFEFNYDDTQGGSGNGIELYGLIINNFDQWANTNGELSAIHMNTGLGQLTVKSCYIGTEPDGITAAPNSAGIYLNTYAAKNTSGGHIIGGPGCERNIISGNKNYGMILFRTRDVRIENNLIGTDINGNPLGNGLDGVFLGLEAPDCDENLLVDNKISYNGGNGVAMCCGAKYNRLEGNQIKGNGRHGVSMLNAICHSQVIGVDASGNGSPNEITENGREGVLVGTWGGDAGGGDAGGASRLATIRQNSIYCNGQDANYVNGDPSRGKAINLTNPNSSGGSGNDGYAAPIIDVANSTTMIIQGLPVAANNSALIDIYQMSECANCASDGSSQGDGFIWLGQTIAAGDGSWTYNPTTTLGGQIAATATENTNTWANTSEFSSCKYIDDNPTCINPPIAQINTIGQTLCTNNISLEASPLQIGETGLWTVSPANGNVIINFPTSLTTSVDILASGSYTFTWTVTSSIDDCPIVSDDVIFTITLTPEIDGGPDQTICSDPGSANLDAASLTFGSGMWSSGSALTFNDNTDEKALVSDLSAGTHTLVWTVSINGCSDLTDELVITVDQAPQDIDMPDEPHCNPNAAITLTAPQAGGTWRNVPNSNGVINGNLNPNPNTQQSITIPNFTGGQPDAFLYWSYASGNSCPDIGDTVIILLDGAPAFADAGEDDITCDGTYSLQANAPTSGSGTWSGHPSINGSIDPNAQLSGLTNDVTLTWTVTGCADTDVDQVTIRVGGVQDANAGSDQVVCENNSPDDLSANVPVSGETGIWTYSGPNSTSAISNTSSPISSVSGLSVGIHTFTWTLSDGTCPDKSDDVIITIDEAPSAAIAGSDDTYCESDLPINLNASVITGNSIGTWTGSTIADNGNPNASITTLPVGTNTLTWTVSVTGSSCPHLSDEVEITIDEAPNTANAGVDLILCESELPSNLAANTVTGNSIGSWSGHSSVEGSILNNEVITSLPYGTTTLTWTISVPGSSCPSNSDDIEIILDETPTPATVGDNQNVCIADPISLQGNSATVGSGNWTYGNNTTGGSIDDLSDFNSSVSGLSDGDVLEAVWCITNGVCPQSCDSMTFTSTGIASPSVTLYGDADNVCEGTEITFTATGLNGGDSPLFTFHDATTDAILSGPAVNNDYSITAPSNNFSVYVVLTSNSSCLGSNSPDAHSDNWEVDVDLNPSAASAGSDQTICTESVTLQASAPAIGTGSWTLSSGTGIIDQEDLVNSTMSSIPENTTQVARWTVSNGVCPPTSDDVNIERVGNLTTPFAGNDQRVCETETVTLSANNPALGETGSWSTAGDGTFVDTANPTTTYSLGANDIANGSVSLTWAMNNGNCPEATDDLTISIDLAPTTAVLGEDQTICTTSTPLSGNIPVIGIGTWSVESGTGSISSVNSPTASLDNIAASSIEVIRWTISNGECPASFDKIEIERVGDLTTPLAGSDQAVCENEIINLSGNNPASNETAIWSTNGDGDFGDEAMGSTTYTPGANDISSGSVTLSWTTSNGSCPDATDQLEVFIDLIPTTAITDEDQEFCDGPISLTGNSPIIGNGQWTINSGSGELSSTTNPTATLDKINTPDVIALTWTISNGECPSSRANVKYTTTGNISPSIEINGLVTKCNGETLNLSTSISGGGNAPAFEWFIDDVSTSTSQSVNLTNLKHGQSIRVEMTSSLTCVNFATATDEIKADFVALPTPQLQGIDKTICQGNTVTLNAVTGTGALQWVNSTLDFPLPNENGSSIDINYSGTFYIEEDNGICPIVKSESITVTVLEQPIVNAGGEREIFVEESTVLDGSVSIGIVSWNSELFLDDPTSATPTFTPTGDAAGYMTYTIYGTNGICVDSDQVTLVVRTPIRIPNTFTPNNDGTYDIWNITGLEGYPDAWLRIFNRWGNEVYFGRGDQLKLWDGKTKNGKDLPVATYYYLLHLGTSDENTNQLKGHVTIIR